MLSLLGTALLFTQQLALDAGPAVRPLGPAHAVRITGDAPRLDGRLDDAAWSLATPLTGFRQREPSWGAAPSESTEARVVFSEGALYVAIRAFDREPGLIAGPLARRDAAPPSDWVAVAIDGYYDRRTAFHFAVNPAGVQVDAFRYDDTAADTTWNGVWESAVARDSLGWVAELRIPWSQLRFGTGGDATRFGFNVFRHIARRGEWLRWRVSDVGATGDVSTFGVLEGLEGLRSPRPVEVAPYVLGGGTLRAADAADPFSGNSSHRSAGADLRAGVTADLTLTAAVNPDFGQVEADPAVLNLSASETFLPERRPFFAEGTDLFRFSIAPSIWSSEGLFYSRRIGRAPQREADPRGGHAEAIGGTTILGAGKLSGRTARGWTLGLLGALTAEEEVGVIDSAGQRLREIVEPRTLYLVGRLGRELRGGRTVTGLFGTATARDLPAGLTDLRARAVALGGTLEHRFAADRWHLSAQWAGSRVSGSPEAMTATQRSSVHYFQRPDDGSSRLDSAATSLGGHAGALELGKRAGAWTGGLRYVWRSPGFEVNDLGYQTWSGQHYARANVMRRWLTPAGAVQSASLSAAWFGFYLWDGWRLQGGLELTAAALTRGHWSSETQIYLRQGGRDPAILRGGPALLLPANWFVRQTVSTDQRRALRLSVTGSAWAYPGETYRGTWGMAQLTWRPAATLELQLAPRFDTWDENRAYVTTAYAGGRDTWIVGQRRVTVTAVGLRLNATVSPALSLQGYGEPFVSRGRFRGFARVADPYARRAAERFTPLASDRLQRAGDVVAADLDGDGAFESDLGTPDFTSVSLRTNLVLRWEYRPASTIFVVWQHGRADERTRDTGFGGGLDALAATRAENTVLIKMTYWLRVR